MHTPLPHQPPHCNHALLRVTTLLIWEEIFSVMKGGYAVYMLMTIAVGSGECEDAVEIPTLPQPSTAAEARAAAHAKTRCVSCVKGWLALSRFLLLLILIQDFVLVHAAVHMPP
jgi:hypothetical protein